MYDAATPTSGPPSSAFTVAAGYIGGDTPHVWTQSEWLEQAHNGATYGLPIYVRSFGGNPTIDAHEALAWLDAYKVPKGCTVALDFEARIDSAYVGAFDRILFSDNGYPVMLYGSESTVLHNVRPSGGYWVALWDGVADLRPGWMGKQYANHEPFDYSVIDDSVVLWKIEGGSSAPVVEEEMPDYTSVSRDAAQTGTGTRTVQWDVTHEDTTGLRNPKDATPGLADGGKHGRFFSVTVDLSASTVGTGTVHLVEVDPNKNYDVTKTYPQHVLGEAFTEVGCVSPGQHLWCQVTADEGFTGFAKVLSWAR